MTKQPSIHIGHLVKFVFDESGMTIAEFARRIHHERTSVYAIFERESVDTLLLAEISVVLNHNFLADIERYYGLEKDGSLVIHVDHLSPEMADQIALLLSLNDGK